MPTADVMSNYLENKLIEHVLRNVTYTSPATVYLCLYTTNPAEDYTGSEVTGGSYARQSIAFDDTATGVTQNTAAKTFTATGSAYSAQVTHIAITDNAAAGGGNLLVFGPLDTPRTIGQDDSLNFAIGAIVVEFK